MGPRPDPRAPAVSLDVIRTRLLTHMSLRDARAVVRRLADYETPSRNSQILALFAILRDELNLVWSYRDMGSVFGMNKGTVYRLRLEAMRDIVHETGRPTSLTVDQEATLIAYITDCFQRGAPLSPRQIRSHVQETFEKHVSSSWTWRLVKRHPAVLQRAIAYPQEDRRMNVTKEIARRHIRNLQQYVQDTPTELILNVDEVGSQEWADRKKREVIIPHQVRLGRVEYAVSRKEKRMSCITTISMAGDVLMPLLVTHRRTIDAAVWEEGWRDGQDFMIRSNDTAYVTRPVFSEYVNGVIVPYIATTRETLNLGNTPAVLLCDNCSSHISDEIKQLLAQNNIRLVTFPPHTSHLFQPLDLVTFAAFKREHREIHTDRPGQSQVWRITKLMKALEHATDSTNNRAAFKRAGLKINPAVFPPVALVDAAKLNEMIDSSTLPDTAEGNEEAGELGDEGRTRGIPVFGFVNEEYFLRE
jgi:hypothetical protein